MFKYPQAVKFHKKVAQLQIDLKPAKETLNQETNKVRVEEGCVFFSIAKAKEDGSGTMDWDNKINMKIEPNDIAKIVMGIKNAPMESGVECVNIFHKSSDVKSTSLKVETGNAGTYKLSMGLKDAGRSGFASIYLNTEDLYVIFKLLDASIPLTLGWA